jgi:hypothetical protein
VSDQAQIVGDTDPARITSTIKARAT